MDRRAKEPTMRWASHVEDKDEFYSVLKNSSYVLTRVRDLLNEELESLDRSEESEKDFETPAWAEKQAFRNGQRAALKRFKMLFEFLP